MPDTRPSIAIPAVSPATVLAAARPLVIDLRSPGEFAEDHIPGAWNVPLFDDVERAVIGTLYVQHSPAEAFAEARERTRAKITALAARVAELASWTVPAGDLEARVDAMTAGGIAAMEGELRSHPVEDLPPDVVALHCWRGGLRSKSVVAFLRALGLERAVVIEGGYKSYRAEVRRRIDAWEPPATFVLRGLTGVGKTLVLREIERLRPGWTLDLEQLAGHRSSILGMVGLEPCTQKTFESRLSHRLDAGFPGPCLVEGESRKVGDVVLPASVWGGLTNGVAIELVASLEKRVQVLVDDYLAQPENRAEIRLQLPFIEERLGRMGPGQAKWQGVLTDLLDRGEEGRLVELLLAHYYDPLYRHSEERHDYAVSIDANDSRAAAAEVVRRVEEEP